MRGSVAGPSPRCEVPPARQGARRLQHKREARLTKLNAFFWQRQEVDPGPPKPNKRFTRDDLKRIKQSGPTLEDVTARITVEQVRDEGSDVTEHVFVPPHVLGDTYGRVEAEPNWGQIAEMPLNLFVYGLKQRNWTSPKYETAAPKWDIQIWRDYGRFMMPSYSGYRVLVKTAPGEVYWVNCDRPGLPTHVSDHLAGAGLGGVTNWPREQIYSGNNPYEVGYNQVFEELFEAYEERLPPKIADGLAESDSLALPRKKLKLNQKYEANNPADRHLAIEFKATPPAPSLRGFLELVPTFLLQASIMSFVFAVVLFGIFRTKKAEPSDLQEALEFAQSKAKARKDGTTGVTLADVAGLDNVKHQFDEVVEFLRDPAKFKASGVRPPKGVLLEGPPGTGKTLIAKAIAGEANVGFYQMSGSEFVEAIVGVGAARVRDLFKRARAYDDPILIFVDEIDALALKRARAGEEANEEREQTLNQLLTEIDGFQPTAGVVFMAATNRASLLDPALMRAGRFDRKITVPRPNAEARLEILKVHARKHRLADDVNLRQLAQDVPGLVGADLANLLNEGALEAVRDGADAIAARHLQEAMDRVLQGDRKPAFDADTRLGAALVRSLAVHESGRAVVAADLRARTGLVDDIEKVSIVRRGASYTRTVYARGTDDQYLVVTRKQLMARLRLQLAGHAAEEVLGLDVSTYSAEDFAHAGHLAELIVQNYCMSDIGVTTYANPQFIDTNFREGKPDVSELFEKQFLEATSVVGLSAPVSDMAAKVEAARHELVREAYDEVKARLTELKPALAKVADELLEKRELTGAEVKGILRDLAGLALSGRAKQ